MTTRGSVSGRSELLAGRGRFVADLRAPGMLHAAFVRAPHAHAAILSVNIDDARAMPGVAAVFTARDMGSCLPLVPGFPLRDAGSFLAPVSRPILCSDRVRHVGDPVALVVATTEQAAVDAVDAVVVDYQTLPAISGLDDRDRVDSCDLFEAAPHNIALRWSAGDAAATSAAFAAAAHIVRITINQARVSPMPIETRGILAHPEDENGRVRLDLPSQGAALLCRDIAKALNLPREAIRIVTQDVGGSFGLKVGTYPDYVAVAHAARVLKQPVRWIASRSEALQSDTHARDVASDAELAMSADGRFLALRTRHDVNLGAYISFAAPHVATHGLAMARTGLYDIPCSTIEVTGHLTNTPWTDAYRGAGKPESILLLERLVDEAARCLGMDRAELRRRNLIVPASLPYRTVSGETYDSGDFIFCLERAVERSGWREADRRASAAQARGRHFGIGLSSWLDVTSAGPIDQAWLRLDTHGRFTAGVGSQDTGQGHLAGFSAIIARRLGISVALSDLAQGDSDTASQGGATYGAKTMGVAGAAVAAAADALLDAARHRAAAIFDVSLEMVDYEAGILAVPDTNHRISLTELAAIEDLAGEGSGGGLPTYPNGCHVCAVEIDAGTGKVELVGYTAIDDFGPILDRPALEGQVAGGIAQGLGQALMERVAFDDFGQLLTGSLMDYALPRATDLVPIGLTLCEDCPCTTNPAGAKGSGQSGTIGALAAAMNAINDAIWRAGRKPIDPPATPNRVWTALS